MFVLSLTRNLLGATILLAAVAVAALSLSSQASALTLTFEGIPDLPPVGNFYSGLGIVFSLDTLALVDSDAGGTGNFANEPSANTIIFFQNSNNAIMDYAAGFTTGFSFFYTSAPAGFARSGRPAHQWLRGRPLRHLL